MLGLTAALCGLSLLLLAAHHLRQGEVGLCAGLVLLAGLCATRRGWLRWAVAGALAWGFFTWLDTGLGLVRLRQALDEPWLRLACIMGAVAAANLAALLLCLGRAGGSWFSRAGGHAGAKAALFLLTAGILLFARREAPLPLLLTDRYLPGWGGLQVFGHGLYAAWLGGLALGAPSAHRKLRPRLWAGFSAVFFLQLGLGLWGLEGMLMTGDLHLPVPALILGGPLYRGHGLFMPILFAATVALVGPAWCSHLCYVGAWDDAASRLGPHKPGQPGRLLWWGRGLALALTVACALGLRWAGVHWTWAVGLAAAFGLGGVALMLTASRRLGYMVHCTAWCPMGLAANLLGRLGPWRVATDDSCTQCGACAKACRYGALTDADIAAGRPGLSCTLCGDCLGSCGKGSLGYRFPGLSARRARTLFLVLAVTLHAVFLAVARI